MKTKSFFLLAFTVSFLLITNSIAKTGDIKPSSGFSSSVSSISVSSQAKAKAAAQAKAKAAAQAKAKAAAQAKAKAAAQAKAKAAAQAKAKAAAQAKAKAAAQAKAKAAAQAKAKAAAQAKAKAAAQAKAKAAAQAKAKAAAQAKAKAAAQAKAKAAAQAKKKAATNTMSLAKPKSKTNSDASNEIPNFQSNKLIKVGDKSDGSVADTKTKSIKLNRLSKVLRGSKNVKKDVINEIISTSNLVGTESNQPLLNELGNIATAIANNSKNTSDDSGVWKIGGNTLMRVGSLGGNDDLLVILAAFADIGQTEFRQAVASGSSELGVWVIASDNSDQNTNMIVRAGRKAWMVIEGKPILISSENMQTLSGEMGGGVFQPQLQQIAGELPGGQLPGQGQTPNLGGVPLIDEPDDGVTDPSREGESNEPVEDGELEENLSNIDYGETSFNKGKTLTDPTDRGPILTPIVPPSGSDEPPADPTIDPGRNPDGTGTGSTSNFSQLQSFFDRVDNVRNTSIFDGWVEAPGQGQRSVPQELNNNSNNVGEAAEGGDNGDNGDSGDKPALVPLSDSDCFYENSRPGFSIMVCGGVYVGIEVVNPN